MEGKDSGIPDMCHSEHSGISEIWIQTEERPCYGDRKDKRKGYNGNKPGFKLY